MFAWPTAPRWTTRPRRRHQCHRPGNLFLGDEFLHPVVDLAKLRHVHSRFSGNAVENQTGVVDFRRDELVLGILRENQSPPLHLLRHLVRVQLQADRAVLAQLWLRIGPIGDERAVDDVPNPPADRQDFHAVPVVLLADAARGAGCVLVDAVAAEEVVIAVAGRVHHQVALIGERAFVLGDGFAPQRDAGVHLAGHEFAFEDQPEVAVLLLREQVGARLGGVLLAVLADDDAVLHGEILVSVPFPAVEVLAVEQFHGLFAGGQLRDLLLAPIGGERLRNR